MSTATTEASHRSMPLLSPPVSSSSSLGEEKLKPKKKDAVTEVSATVCSNCGTTTTPLWRRAPDGDTICNACGLYLKARNTLRPPTMKRSHTGANRKTEANDCGSGTSTGSCPGGGQCNGTGGSSSCAGCPAFNQHQVNRHTLICANCSTTTTPLWRRDEAGSTICNACGLYYKLHGIHRPVSMKRSVIKRRKRLIIAEGASDSGDLEDRDEVSEGDEGRTEERDHQSPPPARVQRKRVTTDKRRFAQARTKHDHDAAAAGQIELPVPPIEDYIVPKRAPLPMGNAAAAMSISRPVPVRQGSVDAHTPPRQLAPPAPLHRPVPPPRSPPTQNNASGPTHSRSHHHTSNDHGHSHSRGPSQPYTSPPLRHSTRPDHEHGVSLPPISYERPSAWRETSSVLPPITLPPLGHSTSLSSPPLSAARAASSSSSTPAYPELADFDAALAAMERIRKKAKVENVQALASLSRPFWDLVTRAESFVYGTGAFPSTQ